MNQNKVCLSIPAQKAYVPVASLALSGLGMVLGLDVDLLGDLRTVAAESLDCLMNLLFCFLFFSPCKTAGNTWYNCRRHS